MMNATVTNLPIFSAEVTAHAAASVVTDGAQEVAETTANPTAFAAQLALLLQGVAQPASASDDRSETDDAPTPDLAQTVPQMIATMPVPPVPQSPEAITQVVAVQSPAGATPSSDDTASRIATVLPQVQGSAIVPSLPPAETAVSRALQKDTADTAPVDLLGMKVADASPDRSAGHPVRTQASAAPVSVARPEPADAMVTQTAEHGGDASRLPDGRPQTAAPAWVQPVSKRELNMVTPQVLERFALHRDADMRQEGGASSVTGAASPAMVAVGGAVPDAKIPAPFPVAAPPAVPAVAAMATETRTLNVVSMAGDERHRKVVVDAPDTGRIEIGIAKDGAQLRVELHCARADVADGLSRHQQSLARDLQQTGAFASVQVDIGTSPDSPGRNPQQYHEQVPAPRAETSETTEVVVKSVKELIGEWTGDGR